MNGLPQESFRKILPLLVPFTLLWVLFWVVPLIFGIDLSMQSPDSSFMDSNREEVEYVGLENFERTLSDPKFRKALSNTLFYVLGSVICIVPLGFFLAIGLYQLPAILCGMIAFCLIIPGLALPGAMSKLFYLFFHGREGALNQYLIIPLGMDPINWMMDPNFIMPSLIMQAVWRWSGVVALFFLCALEGIPRWQFEVAKLEGMSSFSKSVRFSFPVSANWLFLLQFFSPWMAWQPFRSLHTIGRLGGMMDAGLLLVTYDIRLHFPEDQAGSIFQVPCR